MTRCCSTRYSTSPCTSHPALTLRLPRAPTVGCLPLNQQGTQSNWARMPSFSKVQLLVLRLFSTCCATCRHWGLCIEFVCPVLMVVWPLWRRVCWWAQATDVRMLHSGAMCVCQPPNAPPRGARALQVTSRTGLHAASVGDLLRPLLLTVRQAVRALHTIPLFAHCTPGIDMTAALPL